jgi:hypothetical protein
MPCPVRLYYEITPMPQHTPMYSCSGICEVTKSWAANNPNAWRVINEHASVDDNIHGDAYIVRCKVWWHNWPFGDVTPNSPYGR